MNGVDIHIVYNNLGQYKERYCYPLTVKDKDGIVQEKEMQSIMFDVFYTQHTALKLLFLRSRFKIV